MEAVVGRLRWSRWAGWVIGLALPVLGLARLAVDRDPRALEAQERRWRLRHWRGAGAGA